MSKIFKRQALIETAAAVYKALRPNAAAGKRHMKRVAELPCVACRATPVQVHHIRMANLTGAGQKCSDWLTIPLCPADHERLHRGIDAWEMAYGRQIDHVTLTLERLYGG